MSDYDFSVCEYCSHKKCKAYSCNMLDELEIELWKRFRAYEDSILPQMIKDWKKSNKIVKY